MVLLSKKARSRKNENETSSRAERRNKQQEIETREYKLTVKRKSKRLWRKAGGNEKQQMAFYTRGTLNSALMRRGYSVGYSSDSCDDDVPGLCPIGISNHRGDDRVHVAGITIHHDEYIDHGRG